MAYDSATEQYQRTVRRLIELPLAGPSSDGDLSLAEALTVQSDALEKVSLALRAFNRFVVYGEAPDGTESPISSDAKANSISGEHQEFEEAYREALVCLADVGHVVAGPIGKDGARVCIVDGKPLTDYEVLHLWWGREITDQIRRERQS